jgi:PilZ domain
MSQLLVTDAEIERALDALPEGHRVSLGVRDRPAGWFRGQVRQHDPEHGHLVLTCFFDGTGDESPVRSGVDTLVCTQRLDGEFYAARMRVLAAGPGAEASVALRQIGPWGTDIERRHQARVRVSLPATEARLRRAGNWFDLGAEVRDLSVNGLGLSLDREVSLGERVSLGLDLSDGRGPLRARLVVRHAAQVPLDGRWMAGGEFQTITPDDQERLIRFVFARLRARAPSTR